MLKTIHNGSRSGRIAIPSSKSAAHRLLICAAMGASPVTLELKGFSKDILATASCLAAMGAEIERNSDSLSVHPILRGRPEDPAAENTEIQLNPGESGSTLRFLLPLAGLTGKRTVFHTEGRLSRRPLAPFDAALCEHGMHITREGDRVRCEGKLLPGNYSLPGNVSSQYFSALLMALPLLEEDSKLEVDDELESAPYVELTEQILRNSGIHVGKLNENRWMIPGRQVPRLPERIRVEGDWSNAAFFLCMGALSESGISVEGLEPFSKQGDRAILNMLEAFGAEIMQEPSSDTGENAVTVRRKEKRPLRIDASQIPDLVPTLATLACAAEGESVIENASRLRLKESDRIRSTAAMITALGGQVRELPDGLRIYGNGLLTGGTVDAENDHRIAMSAAVAASICRTDVNVSGAECVEKSYPAFWEDLEGLSLYADPLPEEKTEGREP